MNTEPETYLTVHEVAARLKFTPATIRANIRAGKIQAKKFGGHYRITEEQFKAFTNPAPKPERTPRTQRERIARLMRAS